MSAPTPEQVAAVKAKFPERSLHHVEVEIHGEVHHLLMTGPSAMEHRKFSEEGVAALAVTDQLERTYALRRAVFNAVRLQGRWPTREDIERLFEFHPEAIDSLHDILHSHAGASAEVRSKKL